MLNPELIERHPELAQEIEQLQSIFDRVYDFSSHEDQATFAEGMRTLGRHVAVNSVQGRLSIGVGTNGVVSVSVTATPGS